MVGRDPSQGILWLSDELAGFFNSANQYRSGKGSDKEDLLECWSGNGAVIARAVELSLTSVRYPFLSTETSSPKF
jgi:hypothetical protein